MLASVAALLAVFALPAWNRNWAVLRLFAWTITMIGWEIAVGERWEAKDIMSGPLPWTPVLLLVAGVVAVGTVRAHRERAYEWGTVALGGLLFWIVAAQICAAVVMVSKHEAIAEAEASAREAARAREEERDALAADFEPQVWRAEYLLRTGQLSDATALLNRLQVINPNHPGVKAARQRIEQIERVEREAAEEKRRLEEKAHRQEEEAREAAAYREAVGQGCLNICIAARERCYAQYGRMTVQCADLTLGAAECIRLNCGQYFR